MRLLVTSLTAVVLTACGSTGPEDSYVNMTVDGTAWSSSNASLAVGDLLSMTGESPGTDSAIILTFENSGTGTYEIGGSSLTTITYSVGTDEWTASFATGGSGAVIVDRVTSLRVSGTFSGVLIARSGQTPDTVTITNGSFEGFY